MLGKGSFREVSLSIDGMIAGYAFPFPVIFSGGIVPTAWRPMIAYGAYDQPTYIIDVTPLLPLIAGSKVDFALGVNGQGDCRKKSTYNNWFVSGNVKIWGNDAATNGKIIDYHNPHIEETSISHVMPGKHEAEIVTTSNRRFRILSQVNGKNVEFEQDLNFVNRQYLSKDGGKQRVDQVIHGSSRSKGHGNLDYLDSFSYPLSVTSDYSSGDYFSASIQVGYHRNQTGHQIDLAQRAGGTVYLNDICRVVNGTGQSRGRIAYRDDSGRRYERTVRTKKLEVLYDEEKEWRWALFE